MEKIGIFGGSFNPPHLGHIRAAEAAAGELGLSRVLLVPAFEVPHKQLPTCGATPEQRLAMVKLAAQGHESLEVSDIELEMKGQGYTYETLLALEQRCPQAEFTLLLGSDQMRILGQWQNADEILKKARLAVLSRGGRQEQALIAETAAELTKRGARISVVQNPVTEISSTQLRRLLAFG